MHPERQFFYCFGCGAGGDAISFRMRHDGVDFLDAVRSLAAELGIALEEERGARGESGRAALYLLNEAASDHFRHALRSPEGAEARAYLDRRGVPADLRERFQIGFAPRRWDGLLQHLREQRIAVEDATRAGLLASREQGDGHYDRFRGRLVFPIREAAGRLCGFGGRALGDDTPKYLNTPESPVYRKGRALFGLHLAIDAIRAAGRVIVVEGYFDLIALHRAGMPEGVAPCGTALTQEHARQLRRYTREVVLLFDGDDAGRRAAERALPVLLAEGMRVRAAWLPPGLDPDTLLARAGEAELRGCVTRAVPLLDYLIEERAGKAQHAWQKTDVARELAPALGAIVDPLERAMYLRSLALQLELEPSEVERALHPAGSGALHAAPGGVREPVATPMALALDAVSRELLGAIASHPEIGDLLDAEELAALPDPGRELVHALKRGALLHGDGVLSRLLSEGSELSEASRHALASAAASAPTQTRAEAEQALADCIARLRGRAIESEEAQIRRLLAVCEDPEQERGLLERMQRVLERKQIRASGSSPTP